MTIDYQTLELHLLNPFTRRQIKLPSPKTFPYPYCTETPYIGVDYIQKGILSKDPSLTDDNIVLVMFSGMVRLAFLRPGKEGKWIVMDYHKVTFQNIIYYREQFYAVDVAGALLVVEIDHQPKLTKITPCLRYHSYTWKRYLVECSGELLHVRRPVVYDDKPYLDSSDNDNNDWNWDGFPKTYKDEFPFVDRGGVDADDDDRDCSSLNGADGDNDGDDDFPIYRTGIFQSLQSNFKYKWEKVKSVGDYMFLGDYVLGC